MSIDHPHASAPHAATGGTRLLTGFDGSSPDLDWRVVNDNVMGGRSQGGFRLDAGMLHFRGRTNTDGGGFSSLRTGTLDLDLGRRDGIRLRLRGDGRRYTWRLTTDALWRGRPIAYWADFDTRDGVWITVDLPFSDFAPQFRGRRLDGPDLDPARISGMGLMIYDKRDGPFDLTVESVHAYDAKGAFSLDRLRPAHRVLVLGAASPEDRQLQAQLADMDATRAQFDDRDMALVVVLPRGGYTGDGPALTAAEASRVRATLALDEGAFGLRLIGKDGTVKHSAARPSPMRDLYALIDTMPMRKAELRQRP